ncbi:DNA-binding transcriptional LysR family regulator [Mesonia hippocampi]|uniref:DNA-binding transcriptional LysR family regulator n=1 Tax=Mesonia hippocampi TaxID=1628250 RepID=A0A840EFS9_9FLAO|nr:LysR family transcriptional regulator [Mesonia hippocampi]MBB4118072.1 DNA-binding transcriptional LysR family regulator [Mesonia hippocampi]
MDFRLRVFQEVAGCLNFSKAAKKLHVSQPAVSKHIKSLEEKYNTKLFERKANGISLTHAGIELLNYVNKILNIYTEIDQYFFQLQDKVPPQVTIGASTTLAQYIVPKTLALLKKRFPESRFTLINDNSSSIEAKIEEGILDFALIEGNNHNPLLNYEKFLDDELVLVTKQHNTKEQQITLEKLKKLPLVVREEGSGTRNILEGRLKNINITLDDLNVEIILGSTESIKTYLINSNSYAFVSIFSVFEELKNNQLRIIDIQGFEIKRPLYFVALQGYPSKLYDLMKSFFTQNYNL